jgi:hypothetical protein
MHNELVEKQQKMPFLTGPTLNSADPANKLAGNAADVHRVRCSGLLYNYI